MGRLAASTDVRLEGTKVLLSGLDVSLEIRSEDVTEVVSVVSAHPEVRAELLRLQRMVASRGDVVIEGRDIGTVVAPDAQVKIYLTASPLERARRRAEQLGVAGDPAKVTEIAEAIEERDEADATRATSPLVKAPDALVIDSTLMSFEEVVETIIGAVHRSKEAPGV